jgi:hypothetical protein
MTDQWRAPRHFTRESRQNVAPSVLGKEDLGVGDESAGRTSFPMRQIDQDECA